MTDVTGETPNYASTPLPATPVDASPAETPNQGSPFPSSAIPTDTTTPTDDGIQTEPVEDQTTGTDASESIPSPTSLNTTIGDPEAPGQDGESIPVEDWESTNSVPNVESETESESSTSNNTESSNSSESPLYQTDPVVTDSSSQTSENDILVGDPLPYGIDMQVVEQAKPKVLLTSLDIENRFGFHKATIEGPESSTEIHAEFRRNFKEFARGLNSRLAAGREAALAFTALEEASMWAHKAIAANDPLTEELPEPISPQESEDRVSLAVLGNLKQEATTNPFVHDHLASLGLI